MEKKSIATKAVKILKPKAKALPITPQEAKEQLIKAYPDYVIEGINNAINNNYFGQSSFTIKQDDIIKEILNVAPDNVTRGMIFDKHWLDFEEIYTKFGWSIKYDKPAYNESYDAFFEFRPKK